MNRIWNSVAFRLSLIGGALVIVSVLIVSALVYFATIGTMVNQVDKKILEIAQNFSDAADRNGIQSVVRRIETSLADGVDSDVEIFLLLNQSGKVIAGNVSSWDRKLEHSNIVTSQTVARSRGIAQSRITTRNLSDGSFLVIGRDMSDINSVRSLLVQATIWGGILAIILAIVAMFTLRHQIEQKVFSIRAVAQEIEAGNISRRIQISNNQDEFDRLNADINRMLDRIQHLMDGVKNISNAIAHNIKTPLSLIRNRLEEATREQPSGSALASASIFSIERVDQLIVMLEKLLQIAEAESGTRRQPFTAVNFKETIQPLLELYDAAAEEKNIAITTDIPAHLGILGDADLLSSALMNLLDNSLKYAVGGSNIQIIASEDYDKVTLIVQDNGPGIPAGEHDNILKRFYRLNSQQPGSGLGLAIVMAFTQLHGGEIFTEDAHPGLRVKMTFPRPAARSPT